MSGPVVVVVTDLETVTERELFARLDALDRSSAGALVVQLRDHRLAPPRRRDLAVRLRAKTFELGARLMIAIDVTLALEIGADGVHLPGRVAREVEAVRARFENATRRATISVACHSLDDVLAAARGGADLTLLSPIFASPGKGTPLGVAAISEARRALDVAEAAGLESEPAGPRSEAPRTVIVALGGVEEGNAGACLEAGAGGVAAIRAVPARLLAAVGAPHAPA